MKPMIKTLVKTYARDTATVVVGSALLIVLLSRVSNIKSTAKTKSSNMEDTSVSETITDGN